MLKKQMLQNRKRLRVYLEMILAFSVLMFLMGVLSSVFRITGLLAWSVTLIVMYEIYRRRWKKQLDRKEA